MNILEKHLLECRLLHVEQVFESLELIGIETRNKYKIFDVDKKQVGFAAEEGRGLSDVLGRQFLGHWRTFNVTIFDEHQERVYDLDFPFRWIFKTLIVRNNKGVKIGHLEECFAIFRKKFNVYDKNGKIVAKINSSYFKFWTFEFKRSARIIARINKRWSGLASETFTDRDNFTVTYLDRKLGIETKALILATCIMIDIVYYEKTRGS